jgi:hypothetical protein
MRQKGDTVSAEALGSPHQRLTATTGCGMMDLAQEVSCLQPIEFWLGVGVHLAIIAVFFLGYLIIKTIIK